MQSPRVYSLQALLDSNIDPQLRKVMLHEIKSPLLEHSFQMTTDDERNFSPSASFHRQQPNSKSPPKSKSHKVHEKLDSFTVTNSYYETSRIMDNSLQIVSPLQKEVREKMPPPKQSQNHIEFLDQSKGNSEANWCGGVFDMDLKDNEVNVDLDLIRNFVRRKIFKKKNVSTLQKLTFSEALNRLKTIQQMEMHNFVRFIGDVSAALVKLKPYKRNLSLNYEAFCSFLLSNNPVDYQFKETHENLSRIKNRLNATTVSEVMMRLSVSCFEKDNEKKAKLVEHDIEFIIKILNSVENIIEDYASKKHVVEELQTVYEFLAEAFPGALTLQQKLYRLLVSLHIDDYLIHVEELSYVWPYLAEQNHYTNLSFAKDVCRNDVIVRNNRTYDQQLAEEGFRRNSG